MLSIVGIKFLDMAFKLNIMSKMSQGIPLEEIMPNIKMTLLFRYFNAIAYPLTFLLAVDYLAF